MLAPLQSRFHARLRPWSLSAIGCACALLSWGVDAGAALPAFPGAEGYGAVATGGRGGKVIKVTTLAASGKGSLQEAVSQKGARTVVFDVSGVIEGNITITEGDLTVAGQTAPGAGITIRGQLFADYDRRPSNIIVRHLRVRPKPLTSASSQGEQYDTIQFSRSSRFILDHVSASWSSDETIDLYEAKDATIQYCTIEESSTKGHTEGEHNFGMINGPDGARMSLHHNLFAHHKRRAPALATGPAEFRNNVIYNVSQAFVHHNPARGAFNIVGNYFKRGPSSSLQPFYFDDEEPSANHPQYYVRDTYIDDPGLYVGTIGDPWAEASKYDGLANMGGSNRKVSKEVAFADLTFKVTTEDAASAYAAVLKAAGAFPRDVVTRRTVTEVEKRTGAWGARPPSQLLEGLVASSPLQDDDGDGMPDAWEAAMGLSSSDAADHARVMPSGYTAIEEYLHAMSVALVSGEPLVVGGTTILDAGGGVNLSDAEYPHEPAHADDAGTAGQGGGDGSGCSISDARSEGNVLASLSAVGAALALLFAFRRRLPS